MRINFDYYRILSVPIKASSSQLERAYGDRIKQQTRRDYSKSAIAMRKKLLNRAFKILNNPEKRAEYDNKFLAPTNPSTAKTQAEINQDSNDQDILAQTIRTKPQISEFNKTPSFPSEASLGNLSETEIPPEFPPIQAEPYLEIEPPLVIGALIILHELAEYEMVISIGNEYLSQEAESPLLATKQANEKGTTPLTEMETVNFTAESRKDPLRTPSFDKRSPFKQQEAHTDTIFCIASSCLEISREKWRRQEWEEAAIYGEQGLRILQQESSSFCPHLQSEIQSELNLLKPYRILYLLEHNTIGSKLRSRGIKLLQEVLAQRDGIENTSIDPSGLKSDQFLYFIQQIRNYLTLQEQKELFLVESRRGSHPGSCIAAYALIAEGFARKKPSSVMQANEILLNLGQHQNTHWERAVCALLLGQAEESQEVIEQIRQDSTYALIKKRSHDSPDLLPGLCFYGEQWLNKEVLSQFQDLKASKITLGQYFNDSNVQAYLDTVAPITYKKQVQDSAEISSNTKETAQANSSLASAKRSYDKAPTKKKGLFGLLPWLGNEAKPSRKVDSQDLPQQDRVSQNRRNQAPTYKTQPVGQKYHPETTLAEQTKAYAKVQQSTIGQNPSGIYKSASTATGSYNNGSLPNSSTSSQNSVYGDSRQKSVPHRSVTHNGTGGTGGNTAVKTRQPNSGGNGHGASNNYANKPNNPKRRRKSAHSASNHFLKSSFLLIALAAGLGTISFLFTKVQISKKSNNETAKQTESEIKRKSPKQSGITLENGTTTSPKQAKIGSSSVAGVTGDAKTATTSQDPAKLDKPATNVLDQNTAKQVVQKWLDSKKAALGKNYDSPQLEKILTAQMLTQWQQQSSQYKQSKIHRQFSHKLKVRSVKFDSAKPNIATVEAEVKEFAQHYQGDKLNQSQSYDDNLLVRYNLVKQNGSWLIKSSELIKTL